MAEKLRGQAATENITGHLTKPAGKRHASLHEDRRTALLQTRRHYQTAGRKQQVKSDSNGILVYLYRCSAHPMGAEEASLCFWYPKTPPAPLAGRQTCFLLPMVAKREIEKEMVYDRGRSWKLRKN